MAAETLPVLSGVLREQRRSLVLWAIALSAVSLMYVSFYPAVGGEQMDEMIAALPEDLTIALGYEDLGTAAGYVSSTVYGLLGPVLLLVFAIGTGARLIAGQEEDGTLELELTSPVSRGRQYVERVVTLWLDVLLLVLCLGVATYGLVVLLDMDVELVNLVAASTGLFLLVIGLGTVALAVGAITGRRAMALGVAAGLAVLAFMLDAIGPTVDAEWMTTVSPFSWYLENDPLIEGFDVPGLLALAAVPLVAMIAGLLRFRQRDLLV